MRGMWVSIVCYLEFSSLMSCEKKLSRVLLVRVLMLRYRVPDGSSEKSSWLGWQESLMIILLSLLLLISYIATNIPKRRETINCNI